ncbi:MAG: glycosyltransferase family 39 protein [Candidatus Palauibacterales bacterium]|nr:glycosyltransferase family 39 protein [Candidatus Palauibacterales bacterium]MDP2583955.1 glycosyltransferase family 39 protein [Candidatus Palauibacterales bacterium]
MIGAMGPGRRGRTLLALLSAGFAVVSLSWCLHDLGRVGVTWDEPMYMAAADRIQGWAGRVVEGPDRAGALGDSTIQAVFDWKHYWNPHPPAFREAMALTGWLTGPVLGRVEGYRLASVVWMALLAGLLAWCAGRAWGVAGCVGAGAALLTMPRLLGHAHVAATDMPLTFFWFLGTVGALGYARTGRRAWLAAGAVGLGLALATKFTGYLWPAPAVAWVILDRRARRRWRGLLVLATLGVVVAWLVNPLAWHHPIGYVQHLVHDSLDRSSVIPISTYYVGRIYGFVVPWHEAIVMTLITLPIATLALGGMGIGAGLRRRAGEGQCLHGSEWGGERGERDPLVLASVIEVAFFWALLALPSSPNHDGVRLFLPMFPFVALLAGRGFSFGVGRLRSGVPARWRTAAVTAFGLLLFGPATVQAASASPFYLAYYGESIGGARGAARRGMEATYWYDALSPDFLERVNRLLPRGATVSTFPQSDHFVELQDWGVLRSDLHFTESFPAPYVLLYARKALFHPEQWTLYRRVKPVIAVRYQGVELAGLYVWSRKAFEKLETEP